MHNLGGWTKPYCIFRQNLASSAHSLPLLSVSWNLELLLCLDDRLGNFDIGKEADFIVLDARATPLMAFRNSPNTPQSLNELADRTFSLIMMGDDRAIESVYILGKLAYTSREK